MKNNKKLIIIIGIVFILAFTGAIFAYLFLETDLFKSNQELFVKYISQEIDTLEKNLDFQIINTYENLKNENKYESNTDIRMSHSEGGEVSNPLNNLTAKLNIQKDNEDNYLYADGQILYNDEEYLEAEIIKEKNIYGIRFSDVVKQFITINEDENIELVADDIGMNSNLLEKLISENGILISKQQFINLKDKYLNMIMQELMNGTFQKQNKAMITYNDVTTETNAYTVSLSSEQVENILIQILNNIKDESSLIEESKIDELIKKLQEELEVPVINITVYEQNQKTIRTVFECAGNKVILENKQQTEGTVTEIEFLKMNSEQEEKYIIKICKQNSENQEEVEITIDVTNGEENYTISLLSKMNILNDKIEMDIDVNHKQGITTVSAMLQNEININKEFEKTETLSKDNNMLISSLEQEKRQSVINLLKEIVPQKIEERTQVLKSKLGMENEQIDGEQSEGENNISQAEINKFNSKFEFYTGDEVSAENVKMLLNVVKNNLANYELINNETQEDNTNSEKIKLNVKLIIEKDKVNEESINKLLEKMNNSSKYKVSIFYKQENGIIDYITITEI